MWFWNQVNLFVPSLLNKLQVRGLFFYWEAVLQCLKNFKWNNNLCTTVHTVIIKYSDITNIFGHNGILNEICARVIKFVPVWSKVKESVGCLGYSLYRVWKWNGKVWIECGICRGGLWERRMQSWAYRQLEFLVEKLCWTSEQCVFAVKTYYKSADSAVSAQHVRIPFISMWSCALCKCYQPLGKKLLLALIRNDVKALKQLEPLRTITVVWSTREKYTEICILADSRNAIS